MRLHSARVLVVDDDEQICELISDALDRTEIRTVCVGADRAAYAAIPTLPSFNAIIVDVNLGEGTTGFDVARFARQVIPEIAVIYISGDSGASALTEHGVPDSDFLEKPFRIDELIERLSDRLVS
jgi:DNA-binding NtrC family response regulator